jgi:tetratricopeptide (TPR) repeat protein
MARSSPSSQPARWGEPAPGGPFAGLIDRVRRLLGQRQPSARQTLGELPLALRRGELATSYLTAEGEHDHRRAGAAATTALDRALAAREWWQADVWGHRALWHFEQAAMELAATRAARMIGDVRAAAGDPASARRFYAEAISEARDLGAEREQGLAAFGLGRAELDLGHVTTSRRLAEIATDLLIRAGAPDAEVAAARDLRGEEKEVR